MRCCTILSWRCSRHAVVKEVNRLHGKGWYTFHGLFPFWPLYLNGQGSTPRRYEPGRDRRTTEGGGPRKECFDRLHKRAAQRRRCRHGDSGYLNDLWYD